MNQLRLLERYLRLLEMLALDMLVHEIEARLDVLLPSSIGGDLISVPTAE